MSELSHIDTVLRAGGIALLPTETVYGLAARADHAAAIDRIYAVKGRDFDKPLAISVRDLAQAEIYGELNNTARQLAQDHWPGPLTLVVPAKPGPELDPRVMAETADAPTIALRCPDADWREQLTLPLALTSANRSGEPDCVDYDCAWKALGEQVDAGLKSDTALSGAPSTIIAVTEAGLKILRQGPLQLAEAGT